MNHKKPFIETEYLFYEQLKKDSFKTVVNVTCKKIVFYIPIYLITLIFGLVLYFL